MEDNYGRTLICPECKSTKVSLHIRKQFTTPIIRANKKEEAKTQLKRYEEFTKYFVAKERLGVPFGMQDLRKKALELKLPIIEARTRSYECFSCGYSGTQKTYIANPTIHRNNPSYRFNVVLIKDLNKEWR